MKNLKRSAGRVTKTRGTPLSRSAANKKALSISSLPLLLDSTQLCWLLCIIYFGVGIIGCWTWPSISNPMLLKSIWAQVALSIVFVAWSWRQYSNRRPLEVSWPRLMFLGFILWISITIFWAIRIDFYVFKWMMWLTGAFGFYLCLQLRMQHIAVLLKGIVLSAVAISLIAIAQVLFGFDVLPQAGIPAGTFLNKNMLGHFMVLSFPASVYLMLRPSNTINVRLSYSISTILILATIYHTTARGSWLAVSFGITIMIAIFTLNRSVRQRFIDDNKTSLKQFIKLNLILLSLFIVLMSFNTKGQFILFFDRIITELRSIVETVENTSGNGISHRYMIWRAGLEMIKDAPVLGYGLGGFFENMLNGYKNFKSLFTFRAHNDYLEIWIETGLIGLIFYLSCLLSIAYCAFYSLTRSNYDRQLMIICIFSAICSSLVNGLFSFPMQLTTPIMIISAYAAILIRTAEEEGVRIIYLNKIKILRPLILIIGVLIASTVILINTQWWQDYNHINKVFNQKEGVYDPDMLAFSPENITSLWYIGLELNKRKRYQHSIDMMTPLNQYWRWKKEYNLLSILFDAYKGLGNHRKATQIAEHGLSHGKHELFDFYMKLFRFYLSESKTNPAYKEKTIELYQRLVNLTNKDGVTIDSNYNYYRILIFMNIKLKINTPEKYYQELERKGVYIPAVERNMAVFYMSMKNREKATKHIKKLLELRPHAKAIWLRRYLKQGH